jgi:hypothetical protein
MILPNSAENIAGLSRLAFQMEPARREARFT